MFLFRYNACVAQGRGGLLQHDNECPGSIKDGPFPLRTGHFFTVWATVSFSRWTSLHELVEYLWDERELVLMVAV